MKQPQAELSFKEKLVEGLSAHWRAVTLILVAIVILMAGILIYDYLRKGKAEDSAVLSEQIQEAYLEWTREAPETRDDAVLTELIDEALSDFSNHFAAQRALFTRGRMALEDEEWEAAAADFESLASSWNDSYLAPVSLFNAASAKEEMGDLDGALESLNSIISDYATISPDAPEALFNIGRIKEVQGDTDGAIEAYKAISADFPDSRWTDLGKSRILVLENR